MDMAGDHADPGHPKPYGCRPPRHTPQPHSRRTPRRTDTRGRTLDTWTLRRPHRTPVTWTGPVGHRTLAPDTGHRMPDTNADTVNDSTAGIRTSLAAMPSDRTLRRAPVLCPRTTRQPLGRLAGQAAPRRTAVLGRCRVERRAAWWLPSGIWPWVEGSRRVLLGLSEEHRWATAAEWTAVGDRIWSLPRQPAAGLGSRSLSGGQRAAGIAALDWAMALSPPSRVRTSSEERVIRG